MKVGIQKGRYVLPKVMVKHILQALFAHTLLDAVRGVETINHLNIMTGCGTYNVGPVKYVLPRELQ